MGGEHIWYILDREHHGKKGKFVLMFVQMIDEVNRNFSIIILVGRTKKHWQFLFPLDVSFFLLFTPHIMKYVNF